MKINEASVMSKSEADGNNVLAQELKQHSKPLETIVRDAWRDGKDYGFSEDTYINETEI